MATSSGPSHPAGWATMGTRLMTSTLTSPMRLPRAMPRYSRSPAMYLTWREIATNSSPARAAEAPDVARKKSCHGSGWYPYIAGVNCRSEPEVAPMSDTVDPARGREMLDADRWRRVGGADDVPPWLAVLLAVLYSIVRLLLQTLVDRGRPDGDLRGELLVLRHQLSVLQRQVKRPLWRPADRVMPSQDRLLCVVAD